MNTESACSAGDLSSIPRLGRSPGGAHGNPVQCPCLESPVDRGAWWAAVHGGHKESGTTERLTVQTHSLVSYFVLSAVCMWQPQSPSSPCRPPQPRASIGLFSMSVSMSGLCSVHETVFRVHVYASLYGICLPLSDSLHPV